MAAQYNTSDNELVTLLKAGDEAAFAEIYSRYWEKMVSYAVRLTKSQEESADITQEIFVSLWNRRTEVVIKGTLASYLIKSTRNLSLRYLERNVAGEGFFEELNEYIIDKSQNIENGISLRDLQASIDLSISKLPKKMREIYVLSRDEQFSYREIAQKLGIAEGTVKKQISNALKAISESLNGQISAAMTAIFIHLLK